MGKIHHDPRYPHQDGEVPHVGKGPKVSYKSGKRKAPHKLTTMQTENDASETDVPTGQGFGYPPQIITDPTYTATVTTQNQEER